MPSSGIRNIVIDCADPQLLARFWSAALGYEALVDRGDWIVLSPASGGKPRVAFHQVPEAKPGKNRLHLDLDPPDTMEVEVERLEGLGAKVVRVVEHAGGSGHTIMQDPEGNEFCVIHIEYT